MFNLAIPDRRYTFDVRRKPSTIGELIEADLMGLRHPSARQMFDHCHSATAMAPGEPWRSDIDIDRLPTMLGYGALSLAFDQARDIVANGTYFDSHCWIFTPASFLELLRGATELGLAPFVLSEFQPTEAGEFEFFATLRRPFAAAGPATLDEMLGAIDAHRTALSRLPDERDVREQQVRGEVARWRGEAEAQRVRAATLEHEMAAAEARAAALESGLRQAGLQGDALTSELRDAQVWASELEGELKRQREAFEAAASWKMTAPLRRLRRLAKRR